MRLVYVDGNRARCFFELYWDQQLLLEKVCVRVNIHQKTHTASHYVRFMVFHSDHNEVVPERFHIGSRIVEPAPQKVERRRGRHHGIVVEVVRLVPIRDSTSGEITDCGPALHRCR